MDFKQMMMMLPGTGPEELMHLQNLAEDMNEEQRRQFLVIYQGKRREQQNLTILTIVGFLGIAGLQRFVTDNVALGVVYLLTLGFCGIGTIIDLINIKSITNNYNNKQAIESAGMIKWMQRN